MNIFKIYIFSRIPTITFIVLILSVND